MTYDGTEWTESDARIAATRWVIPFLRTNIDDPSLAPWSVDNLPEAGPDLWFAESPLGIYDLDGRLLFRDFVTSLQDGNELRVRTSVGSETPAEVLSLSAHTPLHAEERFERAKLAARDRGLTRVPIPGPVCYAYPKLGLLCRDQQDRTVVVDLGDDSLVPVSPAPQNSQELLGVSAFHLPTSTKAAELRAERHRLIRDSGMPNVGDLESMLTSAHEAAGERTLPDVVLRPQETPVYCAVAVAQMILAYHGLAFTQAEIAKAMGTGSSGSTNEQQMHGYQQLGNGGFQPILDTTSTFAEAKSEIGEARPYKSGVPKHARLCAGYRNLASGSGVSTDWLYIYDPWPPGQGSIYWEDWGGVQHTNFLFVRRAVGL